MKKESEKKGVTKGDVENKKSEGEKSENKSNNEIKGCTLDQFIDKNSPWRREKKQILNDPNPVLPGYIKALYPFLQKNKTCSNIR